MFFFRLIQIAVFVLMFGAISWSLAFHFRFWVPATTRRHAPSASACQQINDDLRRARERLLRREKLFLIRARNASAQQNQTKLAA